MFNDSVDLWFMEISTLLTWQFENKLLKKLAAGIKPTAALCFVNGQQSNSREQEGC